MDYSPYLFLAVFLLVAIGFALLPLGLARFWARKFSPAKPGPQKNAIYECGLEAKGEAPIQFKSDYYLYAIIFLVFDVEVLFLLPFAVAFLELPLGASIAMLILGFWPVQDWAGEGLKGFLVGSYVDEGM